MNKHVRAAFALAALLVVNGARGAAVTDEISLPNIVYILADDLGWGSLGCYGADPELVRTPSIDTLASGGRLFTDAYAPASICSPTRYALLTGRYCWRTSLKYEVLNTKSPLHIETNRITVASMLRNQGYATAVIGKWHLGFGSSSPVDYTKPLKPSPLDIGFDYFYGLSSNHGDGTGVFIDSVTGDDGTLIARVAGLLSTNLNPFGESAYGAPYMGIDAPQRVDDEVMGHLAGKAVDWIRAQQKSGKPFFLYYAPVEVHGPVTPSKDTRGTSGAGAYGDFIHDLDLSVGRILKTIDELGIRDNTLVVLTSDNGGEDRNFAKEERKAMQAGLKLNGDLRLGKHTIYEGGIRVPFIARWPGRIPAGSETSEPISLVDTLASLAALVGVELPPPDAGAEDSHNILPVMLGEPIASPVRPPVIGHSGFGVFSIRDGDWKWIEGIAAKPNMKDQNNPQLRPQLYNLASDPVEARNVIDEHPEIAERLSAMLDQYRNQGHSR